MFRSLLKTIEFFSHVFVFNTKIWPQNKIIIQSMFELKNSFTFHRARKQAFDVLINYHESLRLNFTFVRRAAKKNVCKSRRRSPATQCPTSPSSFLLTFRHHVTIRNAAGDSMKILRFSSSFFSRSSPQLKIYDKSPWFLFFEPSTFLISFFLRRRSIKLTKRPFLVVRRLEVKEAWWELLPDRNFVVVHQSSARFSSHCSIANFLNKSNASSRHYAHQLDNR